MLDLMKQYDQQKEKIRLEKDPGDAHGRHWHSVLCCAVPMNSFLFL